MGVAGAIVGGAVIGGAATYLSGRSAAGAAEAGSEAAAQATIEATAMQVEEIRRQFDYQQRVLMPQIEKQYAAQDMYANIMGFGGSAGGGARIDGGGAPTGSTWNPPTGGRDTISTPGGVRSPGVIQPTQSYMGYDAQLQAYQQVVLDPNSSDAEKRQAWEAGEALQRQGREAFDAQHAQAAADEASIPRLPSSTQGAIVRDPNTGAFLDPNIDQTSLAESSTYGDTVRGNLLAGTSAEDDPFRQYVQGNRIAAGSAEDSALVQRADSVRLADGAAGTGVYGNEFQSSPGYAFQVEEMQRELDRKNSAGGNYGGRAIMEAQRRAIGLANQDYYNWAGGRERDLTRLSAAEAVDIQRGDTALGEYERQRIQDIGRDDAAYLNYLERRAGDAQRLDSAASDYDRLAAVDLQRRDQGYYNFLSNLSGAAGFGNPAQQAVQASQSAGSQVANAYGNQGNALSSIASNLGNTQAQINYNTGMNYANTANAALENYITARQANMFNNQSVTYGNNRQANMFNNQSVTYGNNLMPNQGVA